MNSLRQLELSIRLAGDTHRQERIQRFRNRHLQWYEMFERCAGEKVDHLFPKASEILRKRMAESIATRRTRFSYLKLHQEKMSTLNDPAPALHQHQNEAPHPSRTGQQHLEIARFMPLQQDVTGPRYQPSVMLSNTSITKLDPALVQTPCTNTNRPESVSSVKISNGNLPAIPKLDPGGTSFTCPYCLLVCPAKEASGEKEWM